RLHFERNCSVPALDMFGKRVNPALVRPEKIIRKPQVISSKGFPQLEHFLGDTLCGPSVVRIAVDRLCTPVAPVRAATARYEVQRKEAMRFCPSVAVAINIDEFSCRQREQIQIAHQRSRRSSG